MSAARAGRRRFIGAAGVALSAPLAGLGVTVANAADAKDASRDDISALRSLMHEEAARLNARPEGFGSHDRIVVSTDGRSATAALQCILDEQTAIGPDCPLVEMARQQGGGVVTHSQRGVIEYTFTKREGLWTLARAAFLPNP